ncbi:hypothetical protein [Acidiphilium sp.]|uniref:hypothetical protein n=1 Tax=Acidiphilium sp. TaxID=527 RepID=UPI002BBBC121|nr:hypothetical protein [Acidiphilium sp.]HQT62204.1 hypothetical protein [Acidiphilium sp.]
MGDYEDAQRRLLRAEIACWQPQDAPQAKTRARWVIVGIVAIVAIVAAVHWWVG